MTEVDLGEQNSKYINAIFACAANIGKYLDEDASSLYNELKRNVGDLCALDYQRELAQSALSSVKEETDETNVDNLEERFRMKLDHLGKSKSVESHHYMKEFNKFLNTINGVFTDFNDSDVAITQSYDEYLDPITKKRIENPMKNKICGHVYEKDAILELMRVKKKKTICPVSSCANKKKILPSHLEFDEEFKFKLSLKHHSTMIQDDVDVIDLECSA